MITVFGAKTFAEILPNVPRNRDDAYFRFDWAPARIGLQSTSANPHRAAQDSNSVSIPIEHDPRNPRNATIAKPRSASWITVVDGQSLKQIWFISATTDVRTQGFVSAANVSWPVFQANLRAVLGARTYSFTQLGLVHFNTDSGSVASSVEGRRYGKMVEIVGRVCPSDVGQQTGMSFYIARRITRCSISSWDAQRRPLPPNRDAKTPNRTGNDTSPITPHVLNVTGELWDYDMPGGVMTAVNLLGDQHVWDVSFELCVAIGSHAMESGGSALITTDPWPRINAEGLAVSPMADFRANYTATVRRLASATQGIDLGLI
jgi:hypothetical protein